MILIATSNEPGMATQRHQATGGSFTIGRGADCDWTLSDPTRQLSKRHCSMSESNGSWRVTDLSSNGMTLNDRALTPGVSQPVQNGDRLGMGSYDIALTIESAFDGPPAFDKTETDASPFGDGRQGGRLIGDPFVSPGAEAITDPFDVALPPLFEERDDHPRPRPVHGISSDNVSALQQPFEPPRSSHAMLPDDWDEPLSAGATPVPDTPRPTISDRVEPPAFAPFEDDDAVFTPLPHALEPVRQTADPAGDDTGPRLPASDAAEPLPESPREILPGPQPAKPNGPDGDTAMRAFAAFARGAGLDGVPHDTAEEALERLGRAFRAYVVGLRRLLIARATVKGEFRIDRTMIRPFGNNPIKFATDDDDAMSALLGIGRQVGMSAEQAVSDSIRDVRTHEVALTEAFQHGIRELVAELSPEHTEKELVRGPFDAIPVIRHARLWAFHKTRHAKLQASLENSFDSVFGQAFARGYEAALAGMAEPDDESIAGRRR